MRGHRWLAIGVLVFFAVTSAGCQGTGSHRGASAPEPALSGAIESDGGTVAAGPSSVSYVDRHPLFSKPRDYWESSGNNTLVKAAAATFIGVPAGILGEVRQIVVGAPPEVR